MASIVLEFHEKGTARSWFSRLLTEKTNIFEITGAEMLTWPDFLVSLLGKDRMKGVTS